jgi:hypothetical protein
LATLSELELPGCIPTYRLNLSITAEYESTRTFVAKLPPPVFFKSAKRHPIHLLSGQDIFRMFRSCGPLSKVSCDVSVGNSHLVTALQFYNLEGSENAREILRKAIMENSWPDCGIQAYDPAELYLPVCTGYIDLSITRKLIMLRNWIPLSTSTI